MLSRLIEPQSRWGRALASLGLGFGLPVLLYGILLLRSHGNEPQGMCARVPGKSGTLPIQMGRGDGDFTCGLNWDYTLWNLALPALGFALLAYLLMGLAARKSQG